MDVNLFKLLLEEIPESANEISGNLVLLSNSIENSIGSLEKKLNEAFKGRNFKRVSMLNDSAEELSKVSEKIRNLNEFLNAIVNNKEVNIETLDIFNTNMEVKKDEQEKEISEEDEGNYYYNAIQL